MSSTQILREDPKEHRHLGGPQRNGFFAMARRVAVVFQGSRGDSQPYVVAAKALQDAGYEAIGHLSMRRDSYLTKVKHRREMAGFGFDLMLSCCFDWQGTRWNDPCKPPSLVVSLKGVPSASFPTLWVIPY